MGTSFILHGARRHGLNTDWMVGVLGGGVEKEGKVFMRGGAEGKGQTGCWEFDNKAS